MASCDIEYIDMIYTSFKNQIHKETIIIKIF
jgi:hypothetical protein